MNFPAKLKYIKCTLHSYCSYLSFYHILLKDFPTNTKIKIAPSVDNGRILIRILVTVSIWKGLIRIRWECHMSVRDRLYSTHFKKCNLALAMSPTCHSNNTIAISWHEFVWECSQAQLAQCQIYKSSMVLSVGSYISQRVALVKLDFYREMTCWLANFF